MKYQARTKALVSMVSAAIILACSANAFAAASADAAIALARKNSCFKCHSVKEKKTKQGPSWPKIAEKYRGKADAEQLMMTHLSSGKIVKFVDGVEVCHRIIKTSNEGEVDNLFKWILSLQPEA
ncbi:MAG: c-type cytochrome [Sulfuritalea sp.]|jgi:cytochrome c|nr:c-type cytochrome [Sulfuritalea sp.]